MEEESKKPSEPFKLHEAFAVHMLNEHGKMLAHELAYEFHQTLENLKAMGLEGRYLAIVTTKLEEACFFAKKGLASNPSLQQKEEE